MFSSTLIHFNLSVKLYLLLVILTGNQPTWSLQSCFNGLKHGLSLLQLQLMLTGSQNHFPEPDLD